MRILMIGDIVGRPGRRAILDNLSYIRGELNLDFVIANGENAAGGHGITREIARELFAAGIDVFTMGNHVWNKKEIFEYIQKEKRILRPANYPPGTPGSGYNFFNVGAGPTLAIINISGRVFMQELDCPFRKVDEILKEIDNKTKIIFVDFHAEATSEKVAMGWYLDGRVSAICGTHTHVQTADERILPKGSAYITDVGMTGPRDSVIGVETEIVLEKFVTQLPRRFEVADTNYQLNAVMVEVDESTGRALEIERIFNLE
ncbi:TIGR00282 family metallophosphoesterase [Desulforamulus ruminis]|uniref:Metallophosphoesterase n=1 Tax=Desulforamulus ruminis (strain ATCC 23193 / DSM 2154 / NCIMB 8452 / DL) TaxID=696281 RepID=F6DUR5_DESRL|nr:TIGR00282 family metallophosphoesterase [Desulforamulus ruminis]AEG60203.1 metallophosphoesterase [Desulforamulus ruminis DSM 2154]